MTFFYDCDRAKYQNSNCQKSSRHNTHSSNVCTFTSETIKNNIPLTLGVKKILNFRRPEAFTPVVERLAVELPLPVLATWVCFHRDSNARPSACEANALLKKTVSAPWL